MRYLRYAFPLLLLFTMVITGCTSENAVTPPSGVTDVGSTNEQTDKEPTNEQPTETTPEQDKVDTNGEGSMPETTEEEIKPLVQYYVGKHYKIFPEDETLKDEKIALLTFDDSPKNAEVTIQILDILDKHKAKALFFVNGIYIKTNPDMLKEIKERGHLIGNHTYGHKNLRDNYTEEEQRKHIIDLQDQLEELIGERPVYFRPPFGAYTDVSTQIMVEEKMQSMNWSVGSLDWELKKPEEVINQVMTTMHNGANILMHDKQITADLLDELLTKLEADGYKFVLPTKVVNE